MLCSDDSNENTFRRLSALSPYEVAELCEQANTVAVHLQMVADEARTTGHSLLIVDREEDDDTLDKITFPEFMQTDDLENSPPNSHSSVTMSVTETKASTPLVNKSPKLQNKGKELSSAKRSASVMKENKAPTTAAAPSAGRKAPSGVSKACNLCCILNQFLIVAIYFLWFFTSTSPLHFNTPAATVA